MKPVQMVGGTNYERITAEGIRVSDGQCRSKTRLIACDNMVLCPGQEALNDLQAPLAAAGQPVLVIAGALEAGD
jgi:2,4-dienoyl-CoA reductase (NADPH2)